LSLFVFRTTLLLFKGEVNESKTPESGGLCNRLNWFDDVNCLLVTHCNIARFLFINPTGEATQLRRAELILSTIGWVLSSTVAPILLFLYASGVHKARNFLPITALLWPISLFISQSTSYILDGAFYLDYLINYPIFIYTDFILPIFILMIWWDLRDNGFAKSEMSI